MRTPIKILTAVTVLFAAVNLSAGAFEDAKVLARQGKVKELLKATGQMKLYSCSTSSCSLTSEAKEVYALALNQSTAFELHRQLEGNIYSALTHDYTPNLSVRESNNAYELSKSSSLAVEMISKAGVLQRSIELGSVSAAKYYAGIVSKRTEYLILSKSYELHAVAQAADKIDRNNAYATATLVLIVDGLKEPAYNRTRR
ncbi:hypothetical protein Dip510_000179 [Elusimicrobium posterum]|uniref:hypothetical protein n=1 Tax=Elusimicrobium posterum TaxID=3116653 RepID=UPI003C767E86